ncbi:MAG: hypothetical protein ACLS3C_03795 [Oscillospiraceae bacterium]
MKKKTVNPAVKFLQENLVSIGIILLMVVTAVINPTFISASNLTNVLRQLGALPFVALGMTFVIIGGFHRPLRSRYPLADRCCGCYAR